MDLKKHEELRSMVHHMIDDIAKWAGKDADDCINYMAQIVRQVFLERWEKDVPLKGAREALIDRLIVQDVKALTRLCSPSEPSPALVQHVEYLLRHHAPYEKETTLALHFIERSREGYRRWGEMRARQRIADEQAKKRGKSPDASNLVQGVESPALTPDHYAPIPGMIDVALPWPVHEFMSSSEQCRNRLLPGIA